MAKYTVPELPDDVMAGLQRAASLSGRSIAHEIIRRLRESLRDRPNLTDRITLLETHILERLEEMEGRIAARLGDAPSAKAE
jgi:CHASE3 domain sensor protein